MTKPPPEQELIRGATVTSVAAMAGIALDFVSFVIAARSVSQGDFGIFALFLVLGRFAQVLADFGLRPPSPAKAALRNNTRLLTFKRPEIDTSREPCGSSKLQCFFPRSVRNPRYARARAGAHGLEGGEGVVTWTSGQRKVVRSKSGSELNRILNSIRSLPANTVPNWRRPPFRLRSSWNSAKASAAPSGR